MTPENALIRYGHLIKIHKQGCWEWTGTIDDKGYGVISIGERNIGRAHRVIYEVFRGPVPEELDLDHLCHTPTACVGGPDCPHRRCVRPGHLTPATRLENLHRGSGESIRLNHENVCKYGHEMTPENTYLSPGGQKHCRECRKRRDQESRARQAGLRLLGDR